MTAVSHGRIFVISAPSGTGKSTLVRALKKICPDLGYSVSLTTRAPRSGEVDGVDYHFVSREEFMRRVDAGEMAEWAEVFGNLYGTSLEVLRRSLEAGRDILLEIDVAGAAQVRRRFTDGVFIFLLPPSLPELARRLKGRGSEDPEGSATRLAKAEEEMSQAPLYDYQVVNDDLETAVAEVAEIIGNQS